METSVFMPTDLFVRKRVWSTHVVRDYTLRAYGVDTESAALAI